MRKSLSQILLVFPVVLGFYWLTWQKANAYPPEQVLSGSAEVARSPVGNAPTVTDAAISKTPPEPTSIEPQANTASSSDSSTPLQQENVEGSNAVAQVTSVSQLSDVQPTDWAFQALQSLVERYGCIAGYPNGTYRGNRALTRYEFAAGLNACLDRVNELIAAATSDLVRREDLATLQRLREEFAGELASLRGRVDLLEANTAQLEANQFSVTTKLNGLVWFNLTTAQADGRVRVETTNPTAAFNVRPAGRDASGRPAVQRVGNPATTLSYYLFLTLNTSFTGKDALVTQLASGNGNSPANQFASAGLYNTFGVPFTDQTGTVSGPGSVVVRELFYSFPVTDTLQVGVGPRLNWYRYFDNNRFTYFLTGASSFNSSGSTLLNNVDRGSGAVVLWKPNQYFQLNIGYLAENTEFLPSSLYQTSSNPARGLFGGNYSATAELTISPYKNLNIRFLYNRSRIQQVFGRIGGSAGEPLYGYADDGFGGPLNSATADTYEANFDWLIARGVGVFGRYTYGSTHLSPQTPGRARGDVDAQAIQGGLALLDFGKEGAQLTLSYVIPFSVLDGRRFLISNVGNGGVEYDIEATYYYPISDHIAVVPAFYYIANANNFSNNPNIYVGNLRLQFNF